MHKVIFVALILTVVSFGQVVGPADSWMVRYAANVTSPFDSYVNITNAGSVGAFLDAAGDLCANVYVFDPAQELIACCSCPLSANSVKTLSVKGDLISNTLTPGVPSAVTVKIAGAKQAKCNAATVAAGDLVSGIRAWMTTPHISGAAGMPTELLSAVATGLTETPFSFAPLSTAELTKIGTYCGFIQANGSGFGICRSCRAGAAGAQRQ